MGETQKIGNQGEREAAEWLESAGFRIVARNWRSDRYEIDIVAQRLDTMHFVEVKARDEDSWESPEDALDAGKQRAFRYAVEAYLAAHPTELEPQLDLIAVDLAAGEVAAVRYIPEAVIARW